MKTELRNTTPGPWETGEPTKTKLSGYGVIDIIPIGGSGIAVGAIWVTPMNQGEANAAFIVRACNAHEELVAAAERCLQALAANGAPNCEAAKEARAALAKAKS